MIDRYFEAETTECEEVLLKNYLVHGKYRMTRVVKDALAVMSLSATVAARKKRCHSIWYGVGIAASLAVVAIVGAHLLKGEEQDVCEMYIAGLHVPGHEWVADKIQADLREVNEASEKAADMVGSELSDFMDLVATDIKQTAP